jgi:hypothetical protein
MPEVEPEDEPSDGMPPTDVPDEQPDEPDQPGGVPDEQPEDSTSGKQSRSSHRSAATTLLVATSNSSVYLIWTDSGSGKTFAVVRVADQQERSPSSYGVVQILVSEKRFSAIVAEPFLYAATQVHASYDQSQRYATSTEVHNAPVLAVHGGTGDGRQRSAALFLVPLLMESVDRKLYLISSTTSDGDSTRNARVVVLNGTDGSVLEISDAFANADLVAGYPTFMHTTSMSCDIPWPTEQETPSDGIGWQMIVLLACGATLLVLVIPCLIVVGVAIYFARKHRQPYGVASTTLHIEYDDDGSGGGEEEQQMKTIVGSMRRFPSLDASNASRPLLNDSDPEAVNEYNFDVEVDDIEDDDDEHGHRW